MKSDIEQSIKEKLKVLAKSSYNEKFILKEGSLLTKYIHIGREMQDLDFLIQKLSNTEQSLRTFLQAICEIAIEDSFSFDRMGYNRRVT